MVAVLLTIRRLGYSITNLAEAEGVTVQAEPRVYTTDGQAVWDAIILRCPIAVLFVISSTIRIWKLRYSLASNVASPRVDCQVREEAHAAVAARAYRADIFSSYLYAPVTNQVPGSTSAGVYCSSRARIYESVPIVAGRFVVPQLASTLVATSIERKLVAARVPALIINTLHPSISYVSAFVGVNVSGFSNDMVGVVPQVLPTIKRSSVFPADFPMIRILYP